MIITRTPLRISLGGGGTDLPSFYRNQGTGFCISAAINKYIFVGINSTFVDDYSLKYAEHERVAAANEIRHPIIREVLITHQLGPALEIVSLADIPAGTGLGSSGAFTVGLLRAVYSFKREHVMTAALAEEACQIEIERLGRSVGKQDQYIAAFGGLTCFEFHPDGRVEVSPLQITNATLHDLEEHLLLFFTGYSRDADQMLEDQSRRSETRDPAMVDSLADSLRIGHESRAALEAGDTRRFAALMHEHWQRKRGRSPGMSNEGIDAWYETALANGALGGKLVGAGAGGFLLFYAADRSALRAAMTAEGLTELRFTFDHDGSALIVRD